MKSMRICFIAPAAYPLMNPQAGIQQVGGAEVQQSILAKGLAARGHDVSMICLDYGQADGVAMQGVTIYRSYDPRAGLPVVRFVYPRLVSVWAALSRADADVYYQRAADSLTGLMAAYCKRHQAASVFGGAGNPDFEKNTSRIRLRRDKIMYEYGLKNVSRILVQNTEQARMCRDNFGRSSDIVNSSYAKPDGAACDPAGYVLWVSTIRQIKNPYAFLKLARECPDLSFKMIGGPGHGYEDLYRRVESDARVIENLEFLGFVPHHQVDQYFDGARVFVNTSDSEGFPNTFLQSWSRGIPTVSFIDCGARSEGNSIGIVAESAAELNSLTRTLMIDMSQWKSAGTQAKAYFTANNSVDTVVDRYEEIFSEVTGNYRNKTR